LATKDQPLLVDVDPDVGAGAGAAGEVTGAGSSLPAAGEPALPSPPPPPPQPANNTATEEKSNRTDFIVFLLYEFFEPNDTTRLRAETRSEGLQQGSAGRARCAKNGAGRQPIRNPRAFPERDVSATVFVW
jgi:hypothetical protein